MQGGIYSALHITLSAFLLFIRQRSLAFLYFFSNIYHTSVL